MANNKETCAYCGYKVFEPDGWPYKDEHGETWLYLKCSHCKHKAQQPVKYDSLITITLPKPQPMKIKLYDTLTEAKLEKFLQSIGAQNCEVVEIMDKEADLFGDFICVQDYKFKHTYGQWICMQTPTAKHVKRTVYAKKAPNDHYYK